MAKRLREEGAGQGANAGGSWVISKEAVDSLITKKMQQLQRHFSQNAVAYANARVAKGREAQPRYIISPTGIVDHPQKLGWSYLPPNEGNYRVWKKGTQRPWTWIMIHSFGYAWDLGYLRNNRSLERAPGDAYGHHPTRWFAGVRELCGVSGSSATKRRVSIHFCISRRGDVLCSCDINDIAFHGGGDLRIKRGGNNLWSVGFELEPALARYRRAGGHLTQPYILPFTDRQMLALAIVCKKLKVFRPEIENYYASKQNGSVIAQVNAHTGGYFQHKDVANKSDAGAQFDILSGQRGTSTNPFLTNLESGWDQLWNLMGKMRFNLATDVFVKDLKQNDFESLTDISVAMMGTTNAGQRAVMQAHRDRLMALKRAAGMQAQDRRFIYKHSLGQVTTMNDIVAKTAARISKQANQFSTDSVKGVSGDVQTYDFDIGTWSIADVDTGKAT